MGQTTDLRNLKRYVRRRFAEWNVPGLAVGIVRGSDVVHQEVLGLSDVEQGRKVTESTRFAIASATKAFTATAAAILSDEGKLDLDGRVRQYLPGFRLEDEVVADRVTVRDLLCHRTGVPEYPLAWYRSGLARPQLVERLRHLELTAGLREKFQYQNLMYTAAGAVIEAVSGVSFEQFVRERIFEPLGMSCSAFYARSFSRDPRVARGYRLVNGKYRKMPYYDDRATAPAGGIYACLSDMCTWAAVNLNGGVHGGKRLLSERALRACHSPHMAIRVRPATGGTPPLSYGMGWWVSAHRGHLRLWHSGGIDGFCARIDLLPRDGIGVVLMANLDAYPLPNADLLDYVIAMRVYDTLLGLTPINHNRRMRKAAAQAAERQARSRRRSRVGPDLVRLCSGRYWDPGHGTLEVAAGRGGLVVRMHGRSSRIHQKEGSVFEGRVLCENVTLSFVQRGPRCRAVEMRFGDDGQRVLFCLQREGHPPRS